MPDPSMFLLFIATSLAIVVPPGPSVLYIVARSVDQGRLAGIVATLGISTGTLFHIVAAAFGVSAILMSSTLLFNGLKYLGAAYLVYLGVRHFLDGGGLEGDGGEPRVSTHGSRPARESRLGPVYRQGIIVNLLNPKTALFFFAFLPQFADAGKGGVAVQILLLGTLFVTIGFLSDSLWALLAGTVREWIRGNARYLKAQRLFTGGVYIGLGVVTALAGSKP